ncbi:MAG: ATP phosphoribosyltransferase [Saprospiraceae bacterium]|nr:ATP phosphoribosyltransferase [Saprospiraceae bacterium]
MHFIIMLKIAVQKSGRLSEGSIDLLKKCGLKFTNGHNQLMTPVQNYDAQILFLRDDDIPHYVQDGVADVGIIGENVFLEHQANVDVVKKLGFSKCRVSLAIPKNEKYTGIDFFDGKKIATSYPHILKSFLENHGLKAGIHSISGSVEIAPGIGLADAIMDIVSTGSTLLSNGLKEVETVLVSEAILISSLSLDDQQKQQLEQLLFRIEAVLRARDFKYILLNAPNDRIEDIVSILPGMKSPTVLPLAESGWSSIHSVMSESKFWENIDQLKNLGAQGILIVPIEKMVL